MTILPATQALIDSIVNAREIQNTAFPLDNAYVIMDGVEVLAAVGCSAFWGTSGIVWAVVSDSISRKPFSFVKVCKKLLDQKTEQYSRVNAFVDARSTRNNRFIQSLGFMYESTMNNGGPNDNTVNVYRRFN